MINACEAILKMRNESGNLPKYAWPGGYPLFYVDADGNVLCPDCANKNDEYEPAIVAHGTNWEDSSLYCDHCSERIESAYAEDEEGEDDK